MHDVCMYNAPTRMEITHNNKYIGFRAFPSEMQDDCDWHLCHFSLETEIHNNFGKHLNNTIKLDLMSFIWLENNAFLCLSLANNRLN